MAALGIKLTRQSQHLLDCQKLMMDDAFKRWLFTTLDLAGMFSGYFHSEDAVLALGEGRRSLGLDILTDLAATTRVTKAEALSAILAVENKTQKEVLNDNRDRNQFSRDRNRELGGDDDGDDDRG